MATASASLTIEAVARDLPERARISTSALPVATPTTMHTSTTALAWMGRKGSLTDLREASNQVVSGFKADGWRRWILESHISNSFLCIPSFIQFGFPLDLHILPSSSFVPENHKSALDNREFVEADIQKNVLSGRYVGPLSQTHCESFLGGPIRSTPLAVVSTTSKTRLIHNFSFLDGRNECINDLVDLSNFPSTYHGATAMERTLVTLPPGCTVATLDVKDAYPSIPNRPAERRNQVFQWDRSFFVIRCVTLGISSSGGAWGLIADAINQILSFVFFLTILNWVDDFVLIRDPSNPTSLTDIFELTDSLGLPWNDKKTVDFQTSCKYLGFSWNLEERWVELPEDKVSKYLLRLREWNRKDRKTLLEAQKLLGTLIHISFVIRDGRARISHLSHFVSSFDLSLPGKSPFIRHRPNVNVFSDIDWWIASLSNPICPRRFLRFPLPLSNLSIFVDASTSWGIGVLIDAHYYAWQWKAGIQKKWKEIGVGEMFAVELLLAVLSTRPHLNSFRFRVHSDNSGVVDSIKRGRSRNIIANESIRRISSMLSVGNMELNLVLVASRDNLADGTSRGVFKFPPAGGHPITLHRSFDDILVAA